MCDINKELIDRKEYIQEALHVSYPFKHEFKQFMQDLVFREKVNRQLDEIHNTMVILCGRECPGRRIALETLEKLYFGLGYMDCLHFMYCHSKEDLKEALVSHKTALVDQDVDIKDVYDLYVQGLRIVLVCEDARYIDENIQRKCTVLELDSLSYEELYEVFAYYCDGNRISLTSEGKAAVKTVFLMYQLEHKDTSEMAARDLYDKSNLMRVQRNTVPYYSITDEDIRRAIGGSYV